MMMHKVQALAGDSARAQKRQRAETSAQALDADFDDDEEARAYAVKSIAAFVLEDLGLAGTGLNLSGTGCLGSSLAMRSFARAPSARRQPARASTSRERWLTHPSRPAPSFAPTTTTPMFVNSSKAGWPWSRSIPARACAPISLSSNPTAPRRRSTSPVHP